jgi:hypothetical protein
MRRSLLMMLVLAVAVPLAVATLLQGQTASDGRV